MSVVVEIDMYSGLPNPTYELSGDAEKALLKLLGAQRAATAVPPSSVEGVLGYRGIRVHHLSDGKSSLHIYDGSVTLAAPSSRAVVDVQSELEQAVLDLIKPGLRPTEYQYSKEQIEKNVGGAASERTLRGQAEPLTVYEPSKWNDNPFVLQNNNCYNYANDLITNTFAQPGNGGGVANPYPPNCPGTADASVSDGQVRIANPDMNPAQGQIIALVVASQVDFMDYHWYRRDQDGNWTHKPGRTRARNTDNSGNRIASPETCDRGPYKSFCGYFHCVPSAVRIR